MHTLQGTPDLMHISVRIMQLLALHGAEISCGRVRCFTVLLLSRGRTDRLQLIHTAATQPVYTKHSAVAGGTCCILGARCDVVSCRNVTGDLSQCLSQWHCQSSAVASPSMQSSRCIAAICCFTGTRGAVLYGLSYAISCRSERTARVIHEGHVA